MKKSNYIYVMALTLLISCNEKQNNGIEKEVINIKDSVRSNVIVDTVIKNIPIKKDSIKNKAESLIPDGKNLKDYSKHHDLGLKYLIEGDYINAINSINKAIEINSNKADSYYVRGNINQQMGNINEALYDYLTAIEKNPKHSDAMLKCAIIYGKLNNKNKSCDYLKQACDLGDTQACNGLSRFCN